MVNIIKLLTLSGIILLSSTTYVNAHGNTNIEGHKDALNISKLGNYHYHHGEEAHLHENGICEFRKEEAIQKGKEDGLYDGYVNEVQYAYSQNHDYYDYYKESYDKAFEEGKVKLNTEIEEVKVIGKDEGLNGNSSPSKTYSNPIVNEEYINAHKLGYETYRQEKNEEKKREGFDDGKNYRNKISFENLDQDYIASYEEGYNEGKLIYAQTIREEGKKAAFGDGIMNSTYTQEQKQWYEEGFEEGKKLEEELKLVASTNGYEGKDSIVPDEYKYAEDKYNKYYQEGVDKKAKEEAELKAINDRKRNTKIAIGVGIVALILVPTFIIIKKKKANNNVEDINTEDKAA